MSSRFLDVLRSGLFFVSVPRGGQTIVYYSIILLAANA